MHENIRLYVSPERFILEPLYATSNKKEVLHIERNSSPELKISILNEPKTGFQDTVQDIYGVLGIVSLLRGPYLIVITGRKCVAEINNHKLWSVTKTKIIPFSISARLSPAQEQDEDRYLNMINMVLSRQMYFAYRYNITCKAQVNLTANAENERTPLWRRVDERFFWNNHLQRAFIDLQLDDWILPVMMGYIQSETCTINNREFGFTLISRRNWKRAGTRYNMRGVDMNGNVANNVETEQIVSYQGNVSSYVITRGSIPIFWSQMANLKYKPNLTLTADDSQSSIAFRRHFDEQVKYYGHQTIVNLIDQKGSELALGQAYEHQVRKMENSMLKYIAYDFHKEVKGMKYEKLKDLLQQVEENIEKQGTFSMNQAGMVQSTQSGVCRVNCIDNLDRTNVVQSLFARHVLNRQLVIVGVLNESQRSEIFPSFEPIFKTVWANNGDEMSIQYSGTGALKSDFTRTGKRTWKGALNDGYNSAIRYYLNNFKDGQRQDAMDLFLGLYSVDAREPSPFRTMNNSISYFSVMFIAVFMFGLSLFAPTGTHRGEDVAQQSPSILPAYLVPDLHTGYKLTALLFWLAALYTIWKAIIRQGPELVDRPQLVQLQ